VELRYKGWVITSKKEEKKISNFSKRHMIFADALVAVVFIANIILSLLDKQTLSDLSVAIVTVYGGFATAGYHYQNTSRAKSLNDHGLRTVTNENGTETIEYIPKGDGAVG
jgi:hypothetical protein